MEFVDKELSALDRDTFVRKVDREFLTFVGRVVVVHELIKDGPDENNIPIFSSLYTDFVRALITINKIAAGLSGSYDEIAQTGQTCQTTPGERQAG
jgi:hypothetical protein